MTKRNFPPTLSSAPGISPGQMEDDLILGRLATAIGKVGPNIDPLSGARYIYSEYLGTKVGVRTKRKQGIAPQTSVAKQLREIASGAATLSKRLTAASDGNVFDAWALATCDHSATNTRQDVVDQWNTLKRLLEETRERAHKASKTAEEVLRLWRIPGQGETVRRCSLPHGNSDVGSLRKGRGTTRHSVY
jgi:hypothetical protein